MVISRWSDGGQTLTDQYSDGLPIKGHTRGQVLQVPEDEIWVRLQKEKLPWVVNGDAYDEFKERNDLERTRYDSGLRAILIVPLLWRGGVSGSIAFRSTNPEAFDENEVELAVAIAAQIAGAMDAADQFRQLEAESAERQRLANVQARIAEIGRIVSSTLDLDAALSEFVAQLRSLLPYDRIVISTVNEELTEVVDILVHGVGEDDSKLGIKLPFPESEILRESISNHEAFSVGGEDYPEYARSVKLDQYPTFSSLRSFLLIPLVWQGHPIGSLNLRSVDPFAYGESEISIARQVGAQVAGAIATSNQYALLEKESEEREHLAFEQARIAEIGRIVSSTLELNDVFKSFSEQAGELVPFDRLVISLIDRNKQTVVDAYVAGQLVAHSTSGTEHPLSGDIKESVVETSKSLVSNYSDLPKVVANRIGEKSNYESGLRSVLVVPLAWQGDVVGALTFRSISEDIYGERQIQIAEQIGAQIAGAVAAANQYQQLEKALSDSQIQQMAIEAADDAILIRDSDAKLIYVNSAFERQTGFSAAEVLGTNFIYPENVGQSTEKLDQLWATIRSGESWRSIVPSQRKDGSEYIVDATLSPVFNSDGEIDKFLGIRRDITAMFRANESNRIQAAALEAADDAIVIRSSDTTIEYVNAAFERQSGYLRSEVVGSDSKYLPTIKVSNPTYEKMWAHVRSGKTWNAVVAGIHKDGSEYVVDTSLSPIFDDEGKIDKFVGIRRDITARVKAEEANKIQAAALEAAADAVFILNTDTSINWVNEAFVRDTGYSREEAIGKSSPFLRSDKNDDVTFDGLWDQVRTGQTWHGRLWTVRKDGSEYLCEASLTPVFDDSGAITKYVGTRRDITEHVQAEQDREARRDLDAQNQQLLEMNKQREEFFSTVSHELRTPLTSVMAFADIMSRDRHRTLTKLQKEHLDVIKRNSRNLNELVEDMLDFSRMSTDQLKLNKSEFEIHSLLDSVIESLEPTAGQRDQSIVIEPNNEPIWIKADHSRIVQVISNLITNSSKYSPPSTTITVRIGIEASRVSITVSDRGIGIPPEDLENIFSAFFRSDQISVREEIGVGLGLAISKSLVDLHDGKISAMSKLNEGTDITVTLPGASLQPTVDARA
ncbi:PAS domain S-box protein [Candidatus Lucifugimonas marina]|uniref:histidine kinase n=2 Tax=Candidatus Lucifugimonas marina TaxID=3038979 RepID=A0AAJ6CTT1_9CHLR|nr:PAS domain S-box protein [SAR202 cluster bacterium JH702]MDG0869372.1 PAS domain S-box protein [SAR202 cluster bacterium JH639]WFG36769.1 PAS domain S-box protein [SAR202 cluster bacterium JH545]WFG40703.1 PAS domain S-box protein [SAR202 cluster bacterium JH1073]